MLKPSPLNVTICETTIQYDHDRHQNTEPLTEFAVENITEVVIQMKSDKIIIGRCVLTEIHFGVREISKHKWNFICRFLRDQF